MTNDNPTNCASVATNFVVFIYLFIQHTAGKWKLVSHLDFKLYVCTHQYVIDSSSLTLLSIRRYRLASLINQETGSFTDCIRDTSECLIFSPILLHLPTFLSFLANPTVVRTHLYTFYPILNVIVQNFEHSYTITVALQSTAIIYILICISCIRMCMWHYYHWTVIVRVRPFSQSAHCDHKHVTGRVGARSGGFSHRLPASGSRTLHERLRLLLPAVFAALFNANHESMIGNGAETLIGCYC